MSNAEFDPMMPRLEDDPEFRKAFADHIIAQRQARGLPLPLAATQVLPPQPAAPDGVLFADRKRAESAARRNTILRRAVGLALLGGAVASQTVPALDDLTHEVGANLYHVVADIGATEQPTEEQE